MRAATKVPTKSKTARQIADELAADAVEKPVSIARLAADLLDHAQNNDEVLWQLAEAGSRVFIDDAVGRRRTVTREGGHRPRPKPVNPRASTGVRAQQQENARREAERVRKVNETYTWMSMSFNGTKLGECRHAELDRVIHKAERDSTGKARLANFLSTIRDQIPDHKTKVSDVLSESKIKAIAKQTKYSLEVDK